MKWQRVLLPSHECSGNGEGDELLHGQEDFLRPKIRGFAIQSRVSHETPEQNYVEPIGKPDGQSGANDSESQFINKKPRKGDVKTESTKRAQEERKNQSL